MQKALLLFILTLPVFSCKTKLVPLTPPPPPPSESSAPQQKNYSRADFQEMFQRGIDVVAFGNEWELKMDVGNTFVFTAGGNPVTLQGNVPPQIDSVKEIYRIPYEGNAVTIIMENKPCMQENDLNHYAYQVTVIVKGKTYHGCGVNLYDKRIDAKWVLTHINDKPVQVLSTERTPTIEIFADRNLVTGSGGCNRIRGDVKVRGNTFTIGKPISTRMACPEQAEASFAAVLEKVEYYEVRPGHLMLRAANGQRLMFSQRSN